MKKSRITHEQIARNGGIYDTSKYRYIIDTTTDEIKRTLISNLGTTAMLDKGAWEYVAPGPRTGKHAIVAYDADGRRDTTLSADYNNDNYSIAELVEIAKAWTEEDNEGIRYEVIEK